MLKSLSTKEKANKMKIEETVLQMSGLWYIISEIQSKTFQKRYFYKNTGSFRRGFQMYKALDVAKYIINRYREEETPVTNLKLQKLLYYSQVECVAKKGKALFIDEIQA